MTLSLPTFQPTFFFFLTVSCYTTWVSFELRILLHPSPTCWRSQVCATVPAYNTTIKFIDRPVFPFLFPFMAFSSFLLH